MRSVELALQCPCTHRGIGLPGFCQAAHTDVQWVGLGLRSGMPRSPWQRTNACKPANAAASAVSSGRRCNLLLGELAYG